jgi:hypothetical protein
MIRAQDRKSSIESPPFTLPLFIGRHGRSAVTISSRANGALGEHRRQDTEPRRARSDALWRVRAKKEAPRANALEQRLANRRGPGCLWAKAGVALVTSKRVDQFANMSDEELEAYVNGDRGLEH